MNALLINNSTKSSENLMLMLKNFQITPASFIHIPKDLSKFDLIVLSGGSLEPAFFESPIYHQELEMIRITRKPIFGICLGMQLIAQAFSPSKLIKLEPKRRGVIEIGIDWQSFGKDKLKVSEAHRWAVKEINSPLIALGHSTDGVEILKHSSKPIWGVQFHPQSDVDFGTEGKFIFDHFISQIA